MGREIEQYRQAGMDGYLAKRMRNERIDHNDSQMGDPREHPSANEATELHGRDLAEKNNR